MKTIKRPHTTIKMYSPSPILTQAKMEIGTRLRRSTIGMQLIVDTIEGSSQYKEKCKELKSDIKRIRDRAWKYDGKHLDED